MRKRKKSGLFYDLKFTGSYYIALLVAQLVDVYAAIIIVERNGKPQIVDLYIVNFFTDKAENDDRIDLVSLGIELKINITGGGVWI